MLFGAVTAARRTLYRIGALRSVSVAAPVIVVGNLIAGGAGKTPVVMALVEALRLRGHTPGIVSRLRCQQRRRARRDARDPGGRLRR